MGVDRLGSARGATDVCAIPAQHHRSWARTKSGRLQTRLMQQMRRGQRRQRARRKTDAASACRIDRDQSERDALSSLRRPTASATSAQRPTTPIPATAGSRLGFCAQLHRVGHTGHSLSDCWRGRGRRRGGLLRSACVLTASTSSVTARARQ